MSRQRIRLTARGEAVFGTLAGVAFLFTLVIFWAAVGDLLGI
ncbi:hypothetical protein FBY30_2787 [Arthrobacter sp. SLBN-83]|nr:hypothetical protein [Arthrobacter sp. SLBN-83]TQJ60519.1 hypothetical protein FBY30_2787 [Arthrobacter sp. SLBN-83]